MLTNNGITKQKCELTQANTSDHIINSEIAGFIWECVCTKFWKYVKNCFFFAFEQLQDVHILPLCKKKARTKISEYSEVDILNGVWIY